LVHANVIYLHGLRKLRGGIRISGPIAADCEIQQQEEWMVINPLCAGRKVGGRARGIQAVIHIEADHLRGPFHSIDMEAVREFLSWRQCERAADAFCPRISRAMDGAMHHAWLTTDVLHDV